MAKYFQLLYIQRRLKVNQVEHILIVFHLYKYKKKWRKLNIPSKKKYGNCSESVTATRMRRIYNYQAKMIYGRNTVMPPNSNRRIRVRWIHQEVTMRRQWDKTTGEVPGFCHPTARVKSQMKAWKLKQVESTKAEKKIPR